AAGAGAVLHEHLLAEFLAEAAGEHACGDVGRAAGAEPDHQPDILTGRGDLRARRKRPGNGPAAEKCNERASPHSINSSATESIPAGIASPRALAVLRLITSSYLLGVWTGRFPGLSPRRMRSAKYAA